MIKRKYIAVFFLLLGFCPAIFAQDEGARNLSLNEVSELALKNNFDIQLAKYDIQISRQGIDEARSIYDTIFSAEVGYTDDQMAKNSTFVGARSTEKDYSVSLSKSFPTGTTVGIEHSAQRAWTNLASFVAYNPGYNTSTALTVEQDLGRNFFGIQDRGSVKVAIKDVENASYISFDKIEQTLADVQKSYWNLVLSEQLYKIEQEFLEQAKRLYDIDQDRIKHGLVEEPQLLGSEANYQTRWAQVYEVKDRLKASENALKLQLNISEKGNILLRPSQEFVFDQRSISLEESLRKAFEYRRDYQKSMNEIERRNILLSMKKNAAWPEINLKVSLARNGLDDSYGNALNKISEEDNPELSTSLSVSMPLENKEAKVQLKKAELEKAKAILDAKYLERKIAIEIVDQVRKCDLFYERLIALRKAAALETQKALEQEKIFKEGRSDSDIVIRYQEDALSARTQAVSAFYDYYAALIELKRREGTLLPEYWNGKI